MKLIKQAMELNNLGKEIGASSHGGKSVIDIPKLSEAESLAYTLENYPYCLSCHTDYPDRCDCVMNARSFDDPFDLDE